MDPSIVKFLEEDEDETMHSGADVDAFTAALNRDIEGDNTPTSQPSTSTDTGAGTNHTPSQLFQQWQSSKREEDVKPQTQQQESSAMEITRYGSGLESQHQPNEVSRDINQSSRPQEDPSPQQADQHSVQMSQATSMENADKNPAQNTGQTPEDEYQLQRMQRMGNQQAMTAGQPANAMNLHVSQATSMQNADKNPAQNIGQTPEDESQLQRMQRMGNQQAMTTGQPANAMNLHMSQATSMQNADKNPAQNIRQTPEDEFQLQRMQRMVNQQASATGQPANAMNLHMSQATSMQNADKNSAQNIGQTPEDESQLQRMQRMGNQQAMTTGQPANAMNRPARQVPFAHLLPVIEPQLDKDRAMQLHGLYVRLRSNNINKEEFVRHLRSLVGDHMLKMAVYKVQQGQITAKTSSLPMDNNAQKPRLLDHQSDSHEVHKSSNVNAIKQERDQPFPMQGLGKQHQQHMPFPQSSFANYGNTGGNYSSPNMNMSSQSYKHPTHDLQMRQGAIQNVFSDMKRQHGGGIAHFTSSSGLQQSSGHWQPPMHKDQSHMSSMAYAKQEPLDQMNDQQHKSQLSVPQASSVSAGQIESSKEDTFEMMPSRPGFSTPMNKQEPMSITAQLERQNVPAGNSSLASGSNAKTPPKKSTVGQKKPLEAPVSSLSKKQKVAGAFSDQSIEQLNDVTAVSGVNLREEEEQLFSGSKEDSRVSEASRKVVQEEEERLILQKPPLQKKLAEIMAKCGVKNQSNDMERCLSLCVEERMRGLISNLIRLSKQRADIEKPRHRTVVTSDVRKQIMSMNQKAREEWEKKQADAEKLQRGDESEVSGDGEDGRGKSFKVNKEEDDKMRTTAANVAARAAVGGDDMLSKWQLMAEQARQKREGGPDSGSASQPSVDAGPKPSSATERSDKDDPDTEMTTSGAVAANPGPVRKSTGNQELPKSGSIPRTITVKDVISVLGREIQMSRSTLIYRLFEKVRSGSGSTSE